MRRKKTIAGVFLALIVGGALIWQQQRQSPVDQSAVGAPIVSITLPSTLTLAAQAGQRSFADNCASCHGKNAAGQVGVAPPLVHKIYEPSHHRSESFQRAAALGVRAHHWPFGNMPPVEGLVRDDVSDIITYIRELQRANGIF